MFSIQLYNKDSFAILHCQLLKVAMDEDNQALFFGGFLFLFCLQYWGLNSGSSP
jgi:hypothetical protein